MRNEEADTHKSSFAFDDKEDFLKSMMAHLKNEANSSRWMHKALKDVPSSSSTDVAKQDPDGAVSDAAMTLLQESHDAYTRVSIAIKKLGIEILNANMGGNVEALQDRSIEILKAMVPHTIEIDTALFGTPRRLLTEQGVMQVVKNKHGNLIKRLLLYSKQLAA